jgi:hypothetical protein
MIGEIIYDPNQRQFSLSPVKAYMAYRGIRRTVRDVGNEVGRFRENIQPKPRRDQRPTFWGQFNGKNRALREQRQMEHEERMAKLANQPAMAQAKAQAKQSHDSNKYAYKTAKIQGKYGWKTERDRGQQQGRHEGGARSRNEMLARREEARYNYKTEKRKSDNDVNKQMLSQLPDGKSGNSLD